MNYSNVTRRLDQLGGKGEAQIQVLTQDPISGAWHEGDVRPARAGADWSGLLQIRVQYVEQDFNLLPKQED
jgi:hypothetical protein